MAGKPIQRIAIVGFGEVGGIFGKDFAAKGLDVSVFDILFDAKEARDAMLAKARDMKVRAASNLEDCVRGAELVISAVTASSGFTVAKDASRLLGDGQVLLDINSVSPGTKRRMAAQFEGKPAHFVEAAVMAAVPPQRLKVPMLLGGAHAAELAPRLAAIGMNAKAASDQVGIPSAIKMCRSVVIKGLEALAVESMFAARRFGAEEAVLSSLAATFPEMGWKDRLPNYLISRVAQHGKRRAAEMREAAEALREVGMNPLMAEATAERQERLILEMAGQISDAGFDQKFSWQELADAITAANKSAKAD